MLPLAVRGNDNAKGPFANAGTDVAALAEAAKAGDCDRIDKLVARKVDVNAQGEKGITPLIYCVQEKSTKGFERLLVHGADPNLRDDSGDAPIHYAAGSPEHGPEFLRAALAHGADPNLRHRPKVMPPKEDANGVPITYLNTFPTPVFHTIASRNPENLRILLRAGADLKVRSTFGNTPLAFAAEFRAWQFTLILLEAGADFRAKDNDGMPFSYFFTDEDIHYDPTNANGAMKRHCIEFLEKKGVDFAKEKIENEKIGKQIEERAEKETQEILQRLKQREKSRGK